MLNQNATCGKNKNINLPAIREINGGRGINGETVERVLEIQLRWSCDTVALGVCEIENKTVKEGDMHHKCALVLFITPKTRPNDHQTRITRVLIL